MAVRILLLILFVSLHFSTGACAEVPLKAAFIRDHQLWMKEGDKEIQLTTGRVVSSPQWSKDGQFIAYLAGDEIGEKKRICMCMICRKRKAISRIQQSKQVTLNGRQHPINWLAFHAVS